MWSILKKEISSFFNQNTNILATESLPNTDNLKVQDGMDISIIRLNIQTYELCDIQNTKMFVFSEKLYWHGS